MNQGVDLNIVVATGVYAFVELPGFLAYRTNDWIVDLFVREIREGISDTGVKAAFLKCAVDRHGLVGDVPRILSLVADAAVETGAPVMVHTHAATQTGRVALHALVRDGVDPRRVVVAHAGDSNDLDYLRGLADAGAWLGCDRFNIEHFNPSLDADPAASPRRGSHPAAARRDARRESPALLRLTRETATPAGAATRSQVRADRRSGLPTRPPWKTRSPTRQGEPRVEATARATEGKTAGRAAGTTRMGS